MEKTKQYYTFPNHFWIKAQRMGRPSPWMDRSVYLGSKDNLPPGANAEKLKPLNNSISIELREKQQEIFDQCKDWSSCLVEAHTGFGKSVVALSLCEYWGDKTLIICHTKDMVNQFYESFEKFYGKEFTKGKVGRYFSNKKQLCTVTITTTRSFANNTEKFKEYGFSNIIRDEADLEFSETQRNALTDFGVKRLIGMTGTIFKEEFDSYLDKVEGDEPALVRFYGGHVKSEESCSDVLAGIYTLEYDKQYTDQWGIPYSPQKEWIKFREQLDGDKDRKILMMRWIHKNVEKGEHVLVLFDRVADTELFYKAFREHRPDLSSFLVHGSVKKKQREHNIASFKDGGGVMFGQYKTVGRGFDNVKLSKLFILFPVKGENNVVQMFGRVLRKFLDKQSYVYDFVDRSLIFQYRQRKKIYKEKYGVTPVMVNAS